jgi:hypothetical protein
VNVYNQDEEEELIELPELLPVYMHDFVPSEDTLILLPELVNTLFIPGNTLNTSNSSGNSNNINNNNSNNINLDYLQDSMMDRRSDPDLIPIGKPNPVISVKSKLHINFIQQSVNDPHSLFLNSSKSYDGDDESKCTSSFLLLLTMMMCMMMMVMVMIMVIMVECCVSVFQRAEYQTISNMS